MKKFFCFFGGGKLLTASGGGRYNRRRHTQHKTQNSPPLTGAPLPVRGVAWAAEYAGEERVEASFVILVVQLVLVVEVIKKRVKVILVIRRGAILVVVGQALGPQVLACQTSCGTKSGQHSCNGARRQIFLIDSCAAAAQTTSPAIAKPWWCRRLTGQVSRSPRARHCERSTAPYCFV